MTDRIFFPGNPWPAGHPIKELEWTARVQDGTLWFDLHLVTEDYYAEHDYDEDESEEGADEDDNDDGDSWTSPGVWGNYHACTLSSTYWHTGGFKVAEGDSLRLEDLDGLEITVDDPPPEDNDAHAFHVYLLGHDAAGHHKFLFTRVPGTRRFDIAWSGRLALIYQGDDEFRYEFHTVLHGVEAPAEVR